MFLASATVLLKDVLNYILTPHSHTAFLMVFGLGCQVDELIFEYCTAVVLKILPLGRQIEAR